MSIVRRHRDICISVDTSYKHDLIFSLPLVVFLPHEVPRQSCPSVCPSVCLSVALRYRGHIGWNSVKIISRLISLTFSLSGDPNIADLLQREPPNFSRQRSGVGKIVNFRHLSRRISETVQDSVQMAIDHQ